ncbi:MAG: HD domain-containing protein [Pseudomonadota bacterium]
MKCPGQDTRYWRPGDIFAAACTACGQTIEFFKDDTTRRCKKCGTKVLNPHIDFGCATYCKFAEQCLKELPPEILAQRKNIFKDKVACEMRRYFGPDQKRIQHADQAARYAEQILTQEKGDIAVVLAAAYLHDIGIKEAEEKFDSTAARFQEELGPGIARQILEDLGSDQKLIDEVCDIISHHHHPRLKETDNFKALYDADVLVNIEEGDGEIPRDRQELARLIDTRFLTATGKKIAQDMFLKSTEN